LDTDTMKHARTPVTCSISGSQSSPQGTFSINGTAWGYFT
jgi:hypothetical protein